MFRLAVALFSTAYDESSTEVKVFESQLSKTWISWRGLHYVRLDNLSFAQPFQNWSCVDTGSTSSRPRKGPKLVKLAAVADGHGGNEGGGRREHSGAVRNGW
ncbi:hypothetical protein BS50DRAFT_274697 [Corynespora cassiicola Philippines]|uniref:Uncharacterized protein n=1 Tax=Corynespora cassiicola Philippines TaxID=1448308 RepID=A0A2T2P0C8_CORCC|nr:hypothetical protein BS50DRAFT_274697 [Corynespora cassiicola Philippines]